MDEIRSIFKKNFAGGTTEKTPSLESMTEVRPHGVSVSTEGFGDAVTNWFGDRVRNFKEGRVLKLKNFSLFDHDAEKWMRTIKLTYGNPDWLDKRRFVGGEFKATREMSTLVQGINGGISTEPEVYRECMKSITPFNAKYVTYINEFGNQLKPISTRINTTPLSQELLYEVKDQIDNIPNPNTRIRVDLEKSLRYPLGERRWVRGRLEGGDVLVPKTIPTLSKEEIVVVTGIIIELMEFFVETEKMINNANNSHPAFTIASSHNWHGWKQIQVMQEGKYGLTTISRHMNGTDANPYLKAVASIGATLSSDPQTANSWGELLDMYFSGGPFTYHYRWLEAIHQTVKGLSYWVDQSVR